jgi:hypothetical protein
MANSAKKKIAAILMPIAAMRVVVLKDGFIMLFVIWLKNQ